jgi:FKBP-type peptidyl-prolyl cis-trans isomerase SlyD
MSGSVSAIEPNSFVTVAYVLKGKDGNVLDSSREEGGEPIEYVHGYGMLVPGLEAALAGMKPGDTKDVSLTAEEGFGERDEELVLEIDRAEVPNPKEVAIGDELVAESPDGDEVVMRVIEVKKDTVVVDANHPLAGQSLHYAVEICTVRAATPEEIEDAAADLDDAHEHVHGPDCDHTHEPLVGLGGLGGMSGKKTPSGPPN